MKIVVVVFHTIGRSGQAASQRMMGRPVGRHYAGGSREADILAYYYYVRLPLSVHVLCFDVSR